MDMRGRAMPLLPAVYFNNMSNEELYSITPLVGTATIHAADPENLSDDFKKRLMSRQFEGSQHRSHDAATIITQAVPIYALESERLEKVVQEQRECHDLLRADGCPPWYSKTQIRLVVEYAADRPNITMPWKGEYDDGSRVLSKQLHHWRRFRHWQVTRRRAGQIHLAMAPMRARLERLGVAVPGAVELNQWPGRQDELTTWLEYLDFFGMEHVRYQHDMEQRREDWHDHWTRLRKSGYVRDGTTSHDMMEQRETRTAAMAAQLASLRDGPASRRRPALRRRMDHVLQKRADLLDAYYNSADDLDRATGFHDQCRAVWDWAVAHLCQLDAAAVEHADGHADADEAQPKRGSTDHWRNTVLGGPTAFAFVQYQPKVSYPSATSLAMDTTAYPVEHAGRDEAADEIVCAGPSTQPFSSVRSPW